MRATDRLGRTILLAGALGACSPGPTAPVEVSATPMAPVCRVGPDGGRVIGERGIGGTGAASTRTAERGIGGTGIIGVVTGFASVCLADREVALDDAIPVRIEDRPASPDSLRAGQVAVVEADGPADALRARSVAVRFEVSGPVEAVEPGGSLLVAGQRVVVTAQTWGERQFTPGDWVSVSGLRDADLVIQATRIDRRAPGPVVVHGVLTRTAAGIRLGEAAIEVPPFATVLPGDSVTVSGSLVAGRLYADGLVPDVLASDPVAYFGGVVTSVVFEGFITGGDGVVRLGGSRLALPVPRGAAPAFGSRAVVVLARGPDGAWRTQSLRPSSGAPVPGRFDGGGAKKRGPGRFSPGAQAEEGRRFAPAPVPNRGIGGGQLGRDTGEPSGFGSGNRGRAAERSGPEFRDGGASPLSRAGSGPGGTGLGGRGAAGPGGGRSR